MIRQSLQKAFTLIELLLGIAIGGIILALALPSLSEYVVKLRVDNEISELNRLLLSARNTAINSGSNVIICPIDSTCTDKWHQEISVFIDNNNDGDYDAADTIVKVKAAVEGSDKLQYGQSSLTYNPQGAISGSVSANPFSYCPANNSNASRGIVVSASGRSYITSDTDSDGKDEDRSGNEITCT